MDIGISQDDRDAWGLSKKFVLYIIYTIISVKKTNTCLKPSRNQDESKENQTAVPRES